MRVRAHARAILLIVLAFAAIAAGEPATTTVSQPATGTRSYPAADSLRSPPVVDAIRVEGVISPISAEQIHDQILRSGRAGRAGLVLLLDTPGGLETSMRSIVKSILASEIPVITYVSPEGARAASAGLFIVTASHVAGMAPNTNLGAASPVSLGGPMDSTLKHKAMNDAAAFIATLARQRGRNVDWNVRAVREAVAVSEDSALALGVIDYVAPNLEDLLRQANGRSVRLARGRVTLQLAGAEIHQIEPTLRHRLLSYLADPTVAYILFNLGSLGLVFELSNPGAILPGVVGAICLVLALVAFQILPVNFAGILLLILGMGFFLIELKVQSHGILAAGGVLSFLAGSLILFNPAGAGGGALHVSLAAIIGTTLAITAFFVFALGAAIRNQRRKPTTGKEGLVGEAGIALSPLAPDVPGQVRMRGEIWRAEAAPGARTIAPGEPVEVVRIRGLTAVVQPSSVAPREGSS